MKVLIVTDFLVTTILLNISVEGIITNDKKQLLSINFDDFFNGYNFLK